MPDELAEGPIARPPEAHREAATESRPDGRAARTARDGDGAFWRDADGAWRYTIDGSPVPGAGDLTLQACFDPPAVTVDGVVFREIPRAWASRHPEHPLAWVFDYAPLGGRDAIRVPAADWAARADEVVAMAGPELHPHNLVGVDGVAALAGVSPATVRAYLARGQMPDPITRLGGSPVWSRGLVERWLPTRRGRRSADDEQGQTPPADAEQADQEQADQEQADQERADHERARRHEVGDEEAAGGA